MITQQDYKLACRIAENAFRGKDDKGGKPYIEHLRRVSEGGWKNYVGLYPEEQHEEWLIKTIGILHDLVEDCKHWRLTAVADVFNDPDLTPVLNLLSKHKNQWYTDYIAAVAGNKKAACVKLADLEDNSDMSRLTTITEEDQARFLKYQKATLFLIKNL